MATVTDFEEEGGDPNILNSTVLCILIIKEETFLISTIGKGVGDFLIIATIIYYAGVVFDIFFLE